LKSAIFYKNNKNRKKFLTSMSETALMATISNHKHQKS